MREPAFDFAVVGAGIVGLFAAHLASRQHPGWRVLVLDGGPVGQGVSSRSAAFMPPTGRTAWQRRLAVRSAELYEALASEVSDLAVSKVGAFWVTGAAARDRLLAYVARPLELLEGPALPRLRLAYPELELGAGEMAFGGPVASRAEPRRLLHQLVRLLRARENVRCWEGTAVRSIDPDARGEGYRISTSEGSQIAAKRVLAAPGPWVLSGLGSALARASGVRLKKVAALHVERTPRPGDPVISFHDDEAFLMPVPEERRYVLSFTCPEWDCEPDVARLHVQPEDRQLGLSVLARRLPSFIDACAGGRVSCDAYGIERDPLLGDAGGSPDFVVAAGCSGSGFKIGPALAEAALGRLSGWAPAPLSEKLPC